MRARFQLRAADSSPLRRGTELLQLHMVHRGKVVVHAPVLDAINPEHVFYGKPDLPLTPARPEARPGLSMESSRIQMQREPSSDPRIWQRAKCPTSWRTEKKQRPATQYSLAVVQSCMHHRQ